MRPPSRKPSSLARASVFRASKLKAGLTIEKPGAIARAGFFVERRNSAYCLVCRSVPSVSLTKIMPMISDIAAITTGYQRP